MDLLLMQIRWQKRKVSLRTIVQVIPIGPACLCTEMKMRLQEEYASSGIPIWRMTIHVLQFSEKWMWKLRTVGRVLGD